MGLAKNQAVEKQMQARAKRGKKAVKLSFEDYKIHEIPFTTDHKTDFQDNYDKETFNVRTVLNLIDDSVKLSIRWINEGRTAQISYSVVDAGHGDAGCVVTAFGPDIVTALAVMQYKLDVIIGENGIRETAEMIRDSGVDIG